MNQLKNKKPLSSKAKTEIAVICSVAAGWVGVMTQRASIQSPIVWLVPFGIITVYLLFKLWTAAPTPRKNKQTEKYQLFWWQITIQMLTIFVLYFMTTATLRGSIDGYNEWFSVTIAVAYLLAVPMTLKHFFWTKQKASRA